MDDIAARADITKRALYQHFRSKDDLITEALAYSKIGHCKATRVPACLKSGRIDRFVFHPAQELGREAKVVGRWFYARSCGALQICAVIPHGQSHVGTRLR